MKPFLDIGKSQQEIMLAIILACPIVGMLLLFGLGLSDATQQETPSERSKNVSNNTISNYIPLFCSTNCMKIKK